MMVLTNGRLGRPCIKCNKRFVPNSIRSRVCDKCKDKLILDAQKRSIKTRRKKWALKKRPKHIIDKYMNLHKWENILRCRACKQPYGTMIKDNSNKLCPECYWIDRADREKLK